MSKTTFIHISEMTSLALHGLAAIALHHGELVSAKKIAKTINASEAHLAKVLQRLSKEGLIRSERGPKGGFALAKPMEEITILQVFEIMEGVDINQACPLKRDNCPFAACLFNGSLQKIKAECATLFASRSLADFIASLQKHQSNTERK